MGEGVATGSATGFVTSTPLSQTVFLPDLTHVYFLPPAVEVNPTFLQAVPAFTAENAGAARTEDKTIRETTVAPRLFINSDYLAILDLSAIASRMGGDSSARRHRPCVARRSSKK